MNIKRILCIIMLCLFTLTGFAETYHVSISGRVDYQNYNKLLNILSRAGVGDKVIAQIDTKGGMLDVFYEIKSRLNGEHFRVVVTHRAASAGALILMIANSRQVSSTAEVLFHCGDYTTHTGKRIKASITSPYAIGRYQARMLLNIMQPYRSLFTESEWYNMARGADIRMSGARINNYRG